MNFTEMQHKLTALDNTHRLSFNESTATLTLFSDNRTFSACEKPDGSVHLSVSSDGRHADFTFSCERVFNIFSALITGEKDVRVSFPPGAKKKSAAQPVLTTVLGIVLALGNLLLTVAMIGSYFRYSEANDAYAYLSPALFFALIAMMGIVMAWAGARGKAGGGRLSGMFFGTLLSAAALSLICVIWGSRATDPDTGLHVYIVLTVSFGILLASGIALFVHYARGSSAAAMTALPRLFVVPSQEQLALLQTEIRRRTRMDAISYTLDYERQPSLYESKVGGVPYWDTTLPYPTSENGEKLLLLAQFNLSELPENDTFPKEGMLQFFIGTDELYGMYSHSRVVYHRQLRESVHEKEIRELNIPTSVSRDSTFDSPVMGEFAVSFSAEEVCMTPSDSRFEPLLHSIARELGIDLDEDTPLYELFDDDCFGCSDGHRLLGYPYFTQEDPRSGESLEKYDTMLMQLGSDFMGLSPDKYVMWGDSGVAAFFINSKALAEMNFDDVLYNWDCC